MSNSRKIYIDQEAYAETIEMVNIQGESSLNRELTTQEHENLRSAVGQLLWISNQTRPDVSFEACVLSNSLKQATVAEIFRANKVIKKVKQNETMMTFSKINNIENVKLLVFSDASFKSLPGGASQGGFVIFLSDDEGNPSPIHWQSRKIKRIVKSTLSAECLALQEASECAFYLKTILSEMLGISSEDIQIICFTDNKSLVESLHSTKTLEEKRLILDQAILKDMMQKGEIKSVQWLEKQKQLADPLTKATASSVILLDVLQRGDISDIVDLQ